MFSAVYNFSWKYIYKIILHLPTTFYLIVTLPIIITSLPLCITPTPDELMINITSYLYHQLPLNLQISSTIQLQTISFTTCPFITLFPSKTQHVTYLSTRKRLVTLTQATTQVLSRPVERLVLKLGANVLLWPQTFDHTSRALLVKGPSDGT